MEDDTRALVLALIKLVSNGASPEQVCAVGFFAKRAINYRRQELEHGIKLVDSLMTQALKEQVRSP